MKIKAKVRVNSVQPWNDFEGKRSGEQVTMNPVYSEDKASENYSFSQATPSGEIKLSITNTAAIGAFPQGEEFYVDFTPVDEAPPIQLTQEPKVVENEFLLQFFAWEHLPAHLQEVSRPFGELAQTIVVTLPRNPERTVALRKLLEAKDCAVRAQLAK